MVALSPYATIPCDRSSDLAYRVHPGKTHLLSRCAHCIRSAQQCTWTPGEVALNFVAADKLDNVLQAEPLVIPDVGMARSYQEVFSYFWSIKEPSGAHYANIRDLQVRIRWARDALDLVGYLSHLNPKGTEYFTYKISTSRSATCPFDISDLHLEGEEEDRVEKDEGGQKDEGGRKDGSKRSNKSGSNKSKKGGSEKVESESDKAESESKDETVVRTPVGPVLKRQPKPAAAIAS